MRFPYTDGDYKMATKESTKQYIIESVLIVNGFKTETASDLFNAYPSDQQMKKEVERLKNKGFYVRKSVVKVFNKRR